jgi:hypothetical protein
MSPSQALPGDPIPRSYAQWRHCIEQDCRIPLTAEFIAARQRELADPADFRTQQFIRLYGRDHWQAVLGWFAQAAAEIEGGA